MDNEQLLHYLMFTPIEKLPPMPSHIQNEQHMDLGLNILNLLKSNKIQIDSMDSNGRLVIKNMN